MFSIDRSQRSEHANSFDQASPNIRSVTELCMHTALTRIMQVQINCCCVLLVMGGCPWSNMPQDIQSVASTQTLTLTQGLGEASLVVLIK